MSDFADKLRRRFLVPSPAAEYLRRRMLRRMALRAKVALPAGDEVETERGRCFVRRLSYPLDLLHGHRPLRAALAIDRPRLAVLTKEPAAEHLDLDSCLFLDVETTGLAGGAGTIVFLCGLAWLAGHELFVEQVFLRAFAEEPAALAHIAARLAARPTLVTFVGKSFDRHRLASRMAMHRIDCGILAAAHLDLYHAARRAYRHRLSDTRLRTVEESILGLVRDGDLPGAEAPAAWLSWLDDESGRVDLVFEHNRLDVLSLVALLGVLTDDDPYPSSSPRSTAAPSSP